MPPKAAKAKAAAKPAAKKSAAAKRKADEAGVAAVPAAKQAKAGGTELPVDPLMVGPVHAATGDIVHEYRGNEVPAGCLNVVSWNVNGLRALLKKGNLLQELQTRENPDVICLQEIKIDEAEVAKLGDLLPGYTVHWNCCTVKKGYSGTAMLVRDDVNGQVSVTTTELGDEHNSEGRFQLLSYADKKWCLINTYVPNSGDKLVRLDYRTKEWDVVLRRFMTSQVEAGWNVVWTGDLNVCHKETDLRNPKGNVKNAGFTPEERAGMTTTLGAGFVDTWRASHPEAELFYSFWGYRFNARAKNNGWRLDYFIVNDAFAGSVTASSILSAYQGSDHCPVQLLGSV